MNAESRFGDIVEISDVSLDLAQAGAGSEPVGQVETAKGAVLITRSDGTQVEAKAGSPVFLGDVIETEGDGAVGLLFIDESTFSLAGDGQMTVDDLVYDPATQSGSSAIDVAQGVFTFISGQIAKTQVDAMLITTPSATIGIRGSSGGGNIENPALQNPNSDVPATGTFSLFRDPDGTVGEINIQTPTGAVALNQVNATTQVLNPFTPPTKAVVLPGSAVGQFFGSALDALPPAPSGAGNTGGDQQATGSDQQADRGKPTVTDEAPPAGAEGQTQATQQAAAQAFAQVLAQGGSIEAAFDAATNTAGVAAERFGVDGTSLDQFTPETAVEESLDGQIDSSMGGLGRFGPSNPLSAGRGQDTETSREARDNAALDQAVDDVTAGILADTVGDVATTIGDLVSSGLFAPQAGGDLIGNLLANLSAGLAALDNSGLGPGLGGPGPLGGLGQNFNVLGGAIDTALTDTFLQGGIDQFGSTDAFDEFANATEETTTNSIEGSVVDLVSYLAAEAASNPTVEINLTSTVATVQLTPDQNDIINVLGGTLPNTVTLLGQAQAIDTVNGTASSNDTVILSAFTNAVRVNLVDTVVLPTTTSTQNIQFGTAGSMTLQGGTSDPSAPFQLAGTGSSGDNNLNQVLTLGFQMSGTNASQSSISLSGGNDTLVLANGTNNLSTVVGVEKFQLTGGGTNTFTLGVPLTGQVITGSSSVDHINIGGLSSADTVSAGAGTDVLGLTSVSSTTFGDAAFTNVSGFESVQLASNASYSLTLGGFFNNAVATNGQLNVTGGDNLTSGNVTLSAVTSAGATDAAFNFSGTSGTVSITTTAGNDSVEGGSGNDSFTTGAGADMIIGGAGNDQVTSGDGIDTIGTGAGNDTINAGAGADKITGGAGNDVMTGGTGQDTYIWGGIGEFGDQITDFSASSDVDILDINTAVTSGLGITGATTFRNSVTSLDVSGDTAGIFEITQATKSMSGTATFATAVSLATTALSVGSFTTAAAATDNLVVLYDNATTANAGVFRVADSDADGAIDAGEVSLVAFLEGVGADALSDTNFSGFTAAV